MLFGFFIDLGISSKLDLLSEIIYGLDIIDDLLLACTTAFDQILILLPCALHPLLLFLPHLAQILELLLQVLQDFLLRQLYILKGLKFEARDLIAEDLDLLSLLLLLVTLVLDLFIGLRDFRLQR